MKILRFPLVFAFLSAGLFTFSMPPEFVGSYNGTSKEKIYDPDKGKMIPDANYSISFNFNNDDSVDFNHPKYGGLSKDIFPVINKKNFIFGYAYDTGSFILIKGKITGKGKKLKATLSWKYNFEYYEGKISATKLVL